LPADVFDIEEEFIDTFSTDVLCDGPGNWPALFAVLAAAVGGELGRDVVRGGCEQEQCQELHWHNN
jgi:hypothetical protein